jgi:hypothetical protein
MNVRKLFPPLCLGMALAVCGLAQPPLPPQHGVVSGSVVNTAGVPLRRVLL